jgi:plastocyanin
MRLSKPVMETRTFRVVAVVIVTVAVLALIFGLAAAGCSSNKNSTSYNNPVSNPGPGGPGADEVWMQSIAFNPSTKSVAVGTTITWTNKDGVTHTVTSGAPGSPNGTFDSGNMGNGATFSHTFSSAGTFPYYCRIHGAAMTGTITVQ